MRTLPLFLVLIGFTTIISAAETNASEPNQKVYTWTDSSGTIHYSDRPIQGKDSEVLNTKNDTNIATLAPKENKWQQDYQKDKTVKAKEKKLLDANNEKKEGYCKQIKKRIAIFAQRGRIYNASENGDRSFYTDDEITKEMKSLKNKLKKECS